ncbi:MAG: hypothetical protein ACTSQI_05910 [Candidatus Helarchaeota archaeon]
MQLKTIKDIKLELKRIRKRQETHKNNSKIIRRKNKLREKLWKLLKAQPRIKKSHKPRKKREIIEENEPRAKPKGTGQYL